MRLPHILILLLLAATTTSTACQSQSPDVSEPQSPTAERPLIFPTHNWPLGTDYGYNYLVGELRAEDGCLKLYNLGWEEPNRPAFQQLRDFWLIVWPSDFALRQDGEVVEIRNGNGDIVARAGDIVRLGGRSAWDDDGVSRSKLEESLPKECQLAYYLVGDEVAVVPDKEPPSVPLPGTSLYFPRDKTWPSPVALMASLYEGPLYLGDDCLRIGSRDGPVVVWPPGFHPDLVDGKVVVRNGGGRIMARVGHMMRTGGGQVKDDGGGPCRGKRWKHINFERPR